ncbi:hypothetical protein BASA50_005835 [Batrachochytrium salamandrivorans]|uniref:Uncharacterized protein n=1 Tax=Batrachochytrium salamandrivorans TaxID=1357716 RepID=A0ABQ8FC47_9FUNG|nr:hypothetical protein BASA50_005835 [Batrachochytrium salamandrivorans]
MKLIPFAVLSFLAITVSAQPPQTGTQDAQGSDQNRVRVKLTEVRKFYKKDPHLSLGIDRMERLKRAQFDLGIQMHETMTGFDNSDADKDRDLRPDGEYEKVFKHWNDVTRAIKDEMDELQMVVINSGGLIILPKALDGN